LSRPMIVYTQVVSACTLMLSSHGSDIIIVMLFVNDN